MAAIKLSGQLPPDAVLLTQEEALKHQAELIKSWDVPSETWAIRWGTGILGGSASLVGIYFNQYYRRKLKLGKIGFGTTYVPIIILPGMVGSLLHRLLITDDILLEKTDCPVCVQSKSALLQVGLGCVYPGLLAPLSALMYSVRHLTVKLPDITNNLTGSISILGKLARPIGPQISFIFVGQALLGSFITYLEYKSYYTVKSRLRAMDNEYEMRTDELRFD